MGSFNEKHWKEMMKGDGPFESRAFSLLFISRKVRFGKSRADKRQILEDPGC